MAAIIINGNSFNARNKIAAEINNKINIIALRTDFYVVSYVY